MSAPDLFEQIRAATADVSRQARYVRLREDHLAQYAASLLLTGLANPTYDLEHHFAGSPADTVAFLLTLDSVNFGSGYFPHLRKRDGMSGYFTIATSLKEHWEQEGALTAADLRALAPDDCAVLFDQQGLSAPITELMTLFARALNDLGNWLGQRYDDDPLGPITDAGQSTARLVELAAAMPFFRDVSHYHGQDVPLYKRAQLLAADLALAFASQGPGQFRDLDQLTIFADNVVPHVLRVDGLLEYDDALLARINRGELIPAGSPPEIEIRALAVYAVERLVVTLRASGTPATARQLDFLLWNRGLAPLYKNQPRHRTRTTNY